MTLVDYELSILRMMAGGPSLPWGAAMSAALEYLVGAGYVSQCGTHYTITDLGRTAIHDAQEEDK